MPCQYMEIGIHSNQGMKHVYQLTHCFLSLRQFFMFHNFISIFISIDMNQIHELATFIGPEIKARQFFDETAETMREEVHLKDFLIMSLQNALDETVEGVVVHHCAIATAQLSGVLNCKLSCAVALMSMLSIISLIRNESHIQ